MQGQSPKLVICRLISHPAKTPAGTIYTLLVGDEDVMDKDL